MVSDRLDNCVTSGILRITKETIMDETIISNNIFTLDKKELATSLKKALTPIVSPDIYEIDTITVEGNGLILTIAYSYLPTEQPELAIIHIINVASDFTEDNVKVSFP
jgi:hypothetical protein